MTSYKEVWNAVMNLNKCEFIQWASDKNLIQNINQFRICTGCGSIMNVHFDDRLTDGALWRCSNYKCSRTLTIRINSWTYQSQLTLKTLALLVACWCDKRKIGVAAIDCNISTKTVSKYYQEFRFIVEGLYRNDLSKNPLGNTGGIIQIDESHFFGAKYNLGKALVYKQLWFFGAIDDLTNRVSIEKCESRSEDDLVPMIMSMCNTGSTIWSDSWKSYNNLNLYGFHHSNVNHKNNFRDPITGVHTNKIEGNWNALKKFIRENNVKDRDSVESYVHEWCFRRNIGTTFEKCWKAILE